MCGPSGSQTELAAQGSSISSQLATSFAQNFGDQSKTLASINSILSPIFQAGPDQQGFGANELAAYTTSANQGVGQNYDKASRALNNQLAVRGGGSEVLPTGAAAALKGSLASAAANQMSGEELAITKANYDQGRKNWQEAGAGLQMLSQDYNPAAFGKLATDANQTAFGEASQIQDMKNQEQGDIAGLVASAIPFAGKGIASGLQSLGKGGGGTAAPSDMGMFDFAGF